MVDDIKAFRQHLRNEYQKVYQNPFRYKHAIMDPAVLRYEAARAYAKEYFKYTPRSLLLPFCIIAGATVIARCISKERAEVERQIMNGEITYADRALYKTRHMY
jgi:hypothetical protein